MLIDPAHRLAPAAAAARPRLLVADGTPTSLTALTGLLAGCYEVQAAATGADVLGLACRALPDLILLDVALPGLGGHALCRQLKDDPVTAAVPVLLLSALSGPDDECQGLAAGAADHLHRPLNPATVLARVATQLQARAGRDAVRDRAGWLQAELQARLHEVDALRDATLSVMASFAESRDEDSGNHVRRIEEYMQTLARWLQGLDDPRYALSSAQIDQIAKSAALHDIGKVAIPDGILLKPARLTPEEFSIMKTHSLRGWELLGRAAGRMGDHGHRYLQHAMDIARHHHERWDGTGYPDGLAGEAIPLSARLMAVADVYDALISRRPYKGPMDPDEALRLIGSEAGHHFDPAVVMAMQATVGQISEIAARWQD